VPLPYPAAVIRPERKANSLILNSEKKQMILHPDYGYYPFKKQMKELTLPDLIVKIQDSD
jgi:hypothetical protein